MRHQVIEVPQVQARVTEYRMHTLRCAHCTTLTEAEWPEGVPGTAFGPSVQAWVGLLSGSYQMSKRNIVSLLHDAFGLELSLGTVSRLEQHVSDVLATPVEDARAYVRQQPAVNIDETSWREGTDKAWLWTAATEEVITFAIRQSRGSDVAQELLGDNATAVVGSDRFTAYCYLPVANRQLCWAHLQRTFEVFTERGGQAAKIGTVLLEQVDTLFTWWHRIRDGTLEWSSFRTYLSRIRHRIHMELLYGQLLADPQTATTCANLLQLEPAMVDLRQQARRGTHQQRRREAASRCPLAPHQLRYCKALGFWTLIWRMVRPPWTTPAGSSGAPGLASDSCVARGAISRCRLS